MLRKRFSISAEWSVSDHFTGKGVRIGLSGDRLQRISHTLLRNQSAQEHHIDRARDSNGGLSDWNADREHTYSSLWSTPPESLVTDELGNGNHSIGAAEHLPGSTAIDAAPDTTNARERRDIVSMDGDDKRNLQRPACAEDHPRILREVRMDEVWPSLPEGLSNTH
nr:hypothetical protein [Brevibacterium aurantiacum]